MNFCTAIVFYMVVRLTKFKNCNLYKVPLLALLPIVRNMILLPFLRNYTGFLFKKELFLKTYF